MMPLKPRRDLRWLRRLVHLAIFGVSAVMVLFGYRSLRDEWRLRTAIAEADRLDPGWRWEEIWARRRVVKDEENSATRVLRAVALLPKQWPSAVISEDWTPYSYDLDITPTAQADSVRIGVLRAELAKAAAALGEARGLADMPLGRYAWNPRLDSFGEFSLHCQEARRLEDPIRCDAYVRIQDLDIDGALVNCRMQINLGRSFGDEPSLIAFLCRVSTRSGAVKILQRALAQGEAHDLELGRLQTMLIQDEAEPIFLTATRTERASLDRYLNALRNSQVSDACLMGTIRMLLELEKIRTGREPKWTSGWQKLDAWLETWSDEPIGSFKVGHAAVLEHLNQWVEIAKLPLHAQGAQAAALEAMVAEKPWAVKATVSHFDNTWRGFTRSQAQLRCAIAAIAVERFRLAHGRWPESLQQLVPEHLAEVPVDPFVNQQLRIRRTPDGLVTYSVGPDCQDDNGDIFPTAGRERDIGFRLWDVAKRRQAALPPPKKHDADDK
jgi:hypothetical protein